MDNNQDIKKKYMTKISHTHTRVGRDYQAIIPEFHPKEKRTKEDKEKDLKQLNMEHKAHIDMEREEEEDDRKWEQPRKKKKFEEDK